MRTRDIGNKGLVRIGIDDAGDGKRDAFRLSTNFRNDRRQDRCERIEIVEWCLPAGDRAYITVVEGRGALDGSAANIEANNQTETPGMRNAIDLFCSNSSHGLMPDKRQFVSHERQIEAATLEITQNNPRD